MTGVSYEQLVAMMYPHVEFQNGRVGLKGEKISMAVMDVFGLMVVHRMSFEDVIAELTRLTEQAKLSTNEVTNESESER